MTTATVTPRADGTALLEQDGQVHPYPSFVHALREVHARGVRCVVERFPSRTPGVPAAPRVRVLI